MSSATRRTSCTAIWRKSRGPVPHDRLAFCFGIHNHQPIGNFDHVLVEATERAYRPFLERLHARSEIRLVVHCTGSLLEWLRERAPGTFDLLVALAGRGQVELLTGGFYEPILAVLPDHDKFGQIERLTAFLKTHVGIRPRGMWLAERVWEPHLPRVLVEAGVEYVLVDDRHFALAGLDPEALGGYYLTEDQGTRLRVFPISQRLRYLIPFAEVEGSLEYLATRRGKVPAVTMVDDGEKFGVWPGTHAHVYEKGWLDRFFDRLLATEWLDLATLSDVVDRVEATAPVYLPTASYREMGEWALPLAAQRRLERAKHDLERLGGGDADADLLRGGFWRTFLVKYPEVADTYWKMLRLSGAVRGALARAPHDGRLTEAQVALWRGQANDAYWHGVFGVCYLPHHRRAVKSALLECERRLVESGALLAYEGVRHGSLLGGWFDAGTTPLDPVTPWERALLALPGEPLGCTTRAVRGAIAVTFTRGAEAPVSVEKAVTIREATVEVRYRLTAPAATPVAGRWAVQWNLALTAGVAPGRYLTATARPSLGSTGRERGAAGVALVDEWIGVRARLAWAPAAELAWGPVQTVSVSEAGFERIYQGTAVLVVWPVGLRAGETRELVASITLERL